MAINSEMLLYGFEPKTAISDGRQGWKMSRVE